MSSVVWVFLRRVSARLMSCAFSKMPGAQFGWWKSAYSRNSYSTVWKRGGGNPKATSQGPRRRSRSTSLMAGAWKSGLWLRTKFEILAAG